MSFARNGKSSSFAVLRQVKVSCDTASDVDAFVRATIPRDDAISFPAFLRGVGDALSAKFPLCTRVLFMCPNIV